MIDYAYSREKSAPAGSNLYYSSIFYDNNKKAQLFCFFAFAITLSEISERCSDPGVARIKLQWWHEELERIFNQRARHPIGKSLEIINKSNLLDESLFHQLISFEEKKLYGFKVGSSDDLLHIMKQGPGLLWKICAECFGHIHASTPECAQETGSLLAVYNILQHTHSDIINGRSYLPMKDMESAGISQRDFLDNDTDKTREFFYNQLIYLTNLINKNFLKFPAEDRLDHLHVMIMNRLQLELCKAVVSDNCNLLSRKISLTPLQKLWIAWHTKIKS